MSDDFDPPRPGVFEAGRELSTLLAELVLVHRAILHGPSLTRESGDDFRAKVGALVADVRAHCLQVDREYAAWRNRHFFDPSLEYLHDSFRLTCSCGVDVVSNCRELVKEVADRPQWRKAVKRTSRVLGATVRPLLRTPHPFVDEHAPLSLIAGRLQDLEGVRKKNSHARRWARRQLPVAFALYVAMQGDHVGPNSRPFEFMQAVAVGHAAQRVGSRR